MTVGREVGELAFAEAGLTDRGLAWAREERGRHLRWAGLCPGWSGKGESNRERSGGSGQKAAVLHTAPPGPCGPSSGEF